MTVHEAAAQVSLSYQHVYKLVRDGKFPPPFRLGKSSRWRSDEVQEWIKLTCQQGKVAEWDKSDPHTTATSESAPSDS